MLPVISVDGQPFDTTVEHLAFPLYRAIQHMEELAKSTCFPNLKSASFCCTGLDDVGLGRVCAVTTLEYLDLQDTKVSDDGLANLASLPRLKRLRLKENDQLTNRCIRHLLRLEQLVDLGIHETEQGLQKLLGMPSLKDI